MTKPPIFIQSCHASLEYDQARMFNDLGFKVGGNWDLGSKQRPKIAGVTDHNENRSDFDLILLHQVPDYHEVMKMLLDQKKRVILSAFGQADIWQYRAIAEICDRYEHAYVAPYSVKDNRLYLQHGCPPRKCRLIRFGKYLSDFGEWNGRKLAAYATGNEIHLRGHGCGWALLKMVMAQCPVILTGKRTDEVGGLGEVSEESMHELMADCACFLSFGTVPAAWIMSQMEAWCAGCPTVIYDNGHGIDEENIPLLLANSVDKVVGMVNRLISDKAFRQQWHEASLMNAKLFDVRTIGPQWVDFIKQVMA